MKENKVWKKRYRGMERLKKILTKNINIKTTYMLVLIVVSIGLMVTCFSYALFTAREERTGVLI